MKYSSCITNPSIINQPLDKILNTFVEAGFDGIDIPGEQDLFPVNKIKPVLDTFSNKIRVAEITAAINPNRDLINPDSQKRSLAINYIKYCIKTASKLGCNLTHMCFITNIDNLTNTPHDKLEKLGIEALKICSKEAENLGVKLLLEPLFKNDVTIVNTCDKAAELWSKALNIDIETFLQGKTNFGLLQDIFHMHHEESDLVGMLKKYSKITYHIHVADHPRGLDFTRTDSLFVSEAVHTIKQLNYNHYISFESFDPNYDLSKLKNALCSLKSLEK